MACHAIFSTPVYQVDLLPDPLVREGMLKYMKRFDANFSRRLPDSGIGIFGDSMPGLSTDQLHLFPEFKWLTESLSVHVRDYLKILSSARVGCEIYVQKSWPVVCQSDGGRVQPHTHRNAHLSAVYYIQSEADNKTGWIKFMAPMDHFSRALPIPFNDSDSSFAVPPLQGRLLLFPSSLMHCVDQYLGSSPRYSVSYDLMIVSPAGSSAEMVVSSPSAWLKL